MELDVIINGDSVVTELAERDLEILVGVEKEFYQTLEFARFTLSRPISMV